MNTDQDDTATTGPIAMFVAALPPHVRRAFRPNGNSIPAIRLLAERGVDLKALAHTISGGLKYYTKYDIQGLVTRRLRVAAKLDTQEDST